MAASGQTASLTRSLFDLAKTGFEPRHRERMSAYPPYSDSAEPVQSCRRSANSRPWHLEPRKSQRRIVLKSGLGPGQKHDLTAEAAEIDAGVDLARGRERETVDHDGMNGAVAQ